MSHATQLHPRGSRADDRQMMPRCSLPGNVQDEGYRPVHTRAITTVKWTLEQAVDEELRLSVGRGRYERGSEPRCPEVTRSGAYARQLGTQYGGITALRVPNLRRGNRHLAWPTIQRYERCGGPFLDPYRRHYC